MLFAFLFLCLAGHPILPFAPWDWNRHKSICITIKATNNASEAKKRLFLDKSYIQSQSHSNTSVWYLALLRDGSFMIESSHTRLLLSVRELARVRAVAIRRGIWFKTLSKTERALFGLTIGIVRRIRSSVLSRVLVSIIAKLQVNGKGGRATSLHSLGRTIAAKMSMIAQAWGNTSAVSWSVDREFIRFLEVTYLNTPVTSTANSALLLKRG